MDKGGRGRHGLGRVQKTGVVSLKHFLGTAADSVHTHRESYCNYAYQSICLSTASRSPGYDPEPVPSTPIYCSPVVMINPPPPPSPPSIAHPLNFHAHALRVVW